MFRHNAYEEHRVHTLAHWFLLALLSGCVNAGGFLACGRFVSHVTGFATLFGIDLANGKLDAAFGILSVPLFFLIGVMASAWLVDRPIHKKSRPHYTLVMSIVFFCLVFSALGGHFHYFGEFGAELKLKRDYMLLALLCLASGLQNATITTATGATVRTTHLTGITTDLGIGLVRMFSRHMSREKLDREIHINWIRIGTIASFGTGSALASFFFFQYEYLGFLVPAALALYFVVISFFTETLPNHLVRD